MRKFLQNLKSIKNLMQIFSHSSLSCQAIGSVIPAVKSRTNRYLPVFTMLLMLILGGWNSEVLAAWSGSGSGTLKNGVWYVLYEDAEANINVLGSKTYNLSGPGALLTFQAKRQTAGAGNLQVTDNNDNSVFNGSLSTSYASKSGSVKNTATSLTFFNAGTLRKYFKNVYVTMAQYLEDPSKSSLNFGEADINSDDATMTFTVAWCNLPAMTYPITGTDKDLFSVSVANNSAVGKYNTATFTVKYKHTTAGTHSATLTIKDGNGNNTKTVTLSGKTNKFQPEVTWSSNEAFFNVDDVLTATNSNGLTVTLSSAGNESYVGCVNNTATMLAATSGKITITAHVTGNDIYADRDITKEITITNLEKQYISWNQDFSRLKTTDGTKSITLNATSDSGLPVTYELVGDKTGLSLTQSGSVWTLTYSATECKNTTIVAKQGGNETYAPASSVSKTVKVIDPTKVCDTNETLVNSTVTLKSQSTTYNIDIPSTMTIQVSRTKTGTFDWYLNGFKVEIYSGRNGTGTKLHEYSYGAGDINTSKTISLSNLNIAAQSVKLISDASNGYNVTSVTYTKQKDCKLSANSISFETYPNTTTSAKTFNVSYANYPISLECSNPKFTFSPAEFGDCDAYGSQTVSVTYTAGADEGEDVGYIYVKDNTGATLNTCTLNVSISKVSQSITSHTIKTAYTTTALVELSATANSELTDFVYSASPEGVAVFDGNVMTFIQSGTIAITVTQPGSNIYAPTSATVENVVINKVAPNIVSLPAGTAIPYLSSLSSSTLSGGSADITLRGVEHTPVAGSFVWAEPSHVVTDNAGTHNYSVTFNPQNTGMYAPNTTGSISIIITRANQSLSMNNGTVRVAVDGIDAGAEDSKLDLNSLIASQTQDPVETNRDGAVSYAVISTNASKATINGSTFSATEIGEYTIRATKAQTLYYNEITAEFKVTVTKRANTLTTEVAYTKFVDDEITPVGTKKNSDAEMQTSSSDPTIAYYDVATNKIMIPNSSAKSFNTTDVTIKIWQEATNRFEASGEKTIILTVKKHDNPFACSWGAWTKTANFDEVVPVEFTAANTDYTHSPIVIEQTSGEKVATLVQDDDTHCTITASYVRDDATWHLSQAENYKYKAGVADVTLQVRTLQATCYIFEDNNSEYSFINGINDHTGHYDPAFAINGPAKAISFEEKKDWDGVHKNLITGEIYSVVQYSVDGGGTWRTLMRPDLTSEYVTYTREFAHADDPLGENETVTHIRFGADRLATMYKYYRNIKVSRATNIKPLDKNDQLIESMTMPQNTVGGTTTEKFYMKFSSCDEVVKLASDNSHFSLDKTEIVVDPDDAKNYAEITITYSSNEIGTHVGTITLYTKYQNRTFTVTGTTDRKIQTLTWKEGFEADPLTLQQGLVVDHTNIAAVASSENPVIYSTDNESVIEITMGGLGFKIVGVGTATLTASEAGDDTWFPVSETKTINVTDKKVQTIIWDQELTNDLELGQEITLNAKVYLKNAKTGALAYNASRTSHITYSCPENNVISLEGKKITILGYGRTSITATVAGDDTYEEAQPVSLTVIVYKPSVGCETPLVLNQPDNVQLFSMEFIASGSFSSWTTPEIASAPILLDPANGKPDKLSYTHNGELYNIPLVNIKLCRGTVKAQQRVNGSWVDIEGSEFNNNGKQGSSGNYDWREVSYLQLDENADAIRFVRLTEGQGYHNFKDIKVSLLQYIRPVQAIIENENVLDLGDIELGEDREAVVPFDYSDVKGEIIATKGNEEDATLVISQKTTHLACGSHGQYNLPVTLLPTELGPWSNTITLTDRLTNVSTTITITANVVPGFKYIFEGSEGDDGVRWGEVSNWDDNKKPGTEDAVLIKSDVEISGAVAVGSMTIMEGATVTVTSTGSLTLGEGHTKLLSGFGNLHIQDGGIVTVGTGTFLVGDFIFDASLGNTAETGGSSAQLFDDNKKMFLTGDAYFQLSFDPAGKISFGWYDFTVPFEVNAQNGVYDENGNKLRSGVDYAIMEYSEAKRAANAPRAWTRYSGTLQPAKLYTVTFDDEKDWNTFSFKKKANASYDGVNMFAAEYSDEGEIQDRGWNGFGNGSLQHCQLNNLPAGTKIQIENHADSCYVEREAADYTYAVGTAFFVQVGEAQNIDLTAVTESRGFLAPSRNGRSLDEFRLAFAAEGEEVKADHLWVSASEEATGEYTIGRDLLKMGTPAQAKVAQVWTTRDNMLLCDEEMPLVSNQAATGMTLYAPKAGHYILSTEKMPEDAQLFLTRNGRVIWNLTMSPYEFDLNKGTNEEYGLRIVANKSPQVTTGVDEIDSENAQSQKVLIDNVLYIIAPNGAMYEATGKFVK